MQHIIDKHPCLFAKKLCILLYTLVLGIGGMAQTPRPNVLLILVDDLKPTIGVYGDTVVVSPNIDRLANMGTRFDMAYTNQAVCAPSRINLMLGARSTSTGIYGFGKGFREVYPNAVTMPQYFKNAGYHAESMGKVYHVGHGNDIDEASWSIPHHKEKVIEYLLPESNGRQLTREEAYFQNTHLYFEDLPPNDQLPRGAAWENPDVLDEAYADGRVATHAINRLRKLSKREEVPFFMAVGFARPHLPFSVPKKYWDMYDPQMLPMPEFENDPEGAPSFAVKRRGELDQFFPIPKGNGPLQQDLTRKLIHGYYASISYMDVQVGRIINELDRLGMTENTIIVLWGDHGWHLGDHGSWTKHDNYEQANRIPLLFVSPGVTQPKSATGQLAETVDIFPTLAELAGLPTPKGPQPIDGMSLVPVLKNTAKRIDDHAYHCYPKGGHLGRAIRTKRYRLVEWRSVEDPERKPIYELYDYQEDPLETENLSMLRKEEMMRLIAILEKHPNPKPGMR